MQRVRANNSLQVGALASNFCQLVRMKRTKNLPGGMRAV